MTIVFVNLVLDLCSLIIIMITLYGVLFDTRTSNRKSSLFKHLVGTTLFCILVDLSSFYFIFTAPGGTGWYVSSLIAAIPPFFWVALVMFYVLSLIREKRRISWRIGWIFAGIDAIAVAIGIFYGIRGEAFSWVDNHFESGFMGPVVFGFNVVFLLFYGTVCMRYRRLLGGHNTIALIMYLFIPMAGLCVDAFVPGCYSLLFGMTISVLLCFMMIQHRQLLAVNRAKTAFLNNMSHDIRTPMNAIMGYTELIEKDVRKPEAVEDYVGKIKVSGNYLLNLINNVLDMARIDSGKTELEEQRFDLTQFEGALLPLFEDQIRKNNQRIEVKLDLKNNYVMIDRTKMEQVAVNLISNALKYTPNGGLIEIFLRELPDSEERLGHYNFIVKDNGIGMSPEFAKHVFDQFSRERNTTDSKVMGSGLGMSIVKKLIDLMGGTISVESKQGLGSTFTIDLYLKIIEPEEVKKMNEQKTKKQSFNIAGHRVLLAEDNDLNAEIVRLMLEKEGVEVDHAYDGIDCLKMLSEAPEGYYDLILMDIQMPRMDGYETARHIRALTDTPKSAIPIIAVTADAFVEDRRAALAAGMNSHLVKPINSVSLKKILSKYVY